MTAADSWPHTNRILPWLLALFVGMVYLIPFESIQLPVHLPVNSALDRFALGGLFLVWLFVALAGGGRLRFRHSPLNLALYLFVAVCIASIALNLRDLAWNGELTLSVKQLSLVGSYLVFFYIASTSIRTTEVYAFAKLLAGLATITAVGTIYEYRSGTNLFFQLASTVFQGASILSPPSSSGPLARPLITGPTSHPLADATLLSIAVPFAIVFATQARDRSGALKWLGATFLLVTGCVVTQRKTALIVPAVSIAALVAYEPRRYIRYWPALVVMVGAIRIAAPHAISGLVYQFGIAGSSTSTSARTSDYSAVAPDVVSHLFFGRGYGSFDPLKYRTLDDQMLGWLVQTGVLGLLTYTLVIVASGLTVRRIARRSGANAMLARAIVGVSAGFFVCNFLYDTFGFRQAPYAFFFVAALGVALAGDYVLAHASSSEPAPSGPPVRAGSLTRKAPTTAHSSDEGSAHGVEVSILMVTYRNPDLTLASLRSVIDDSADLAHELLVLDNASEDGTAAEVAKAFPTLNLVSSAENLGFARANNLLAKRATGTFLLLLNPDTIVHPGAIVALLGFAREHPEGGLYGGRTLAPSGAVDPRSCWGAPSLWSLWCFATGLSALFRGSSWLDPESLGSWPRDTVREVDIVTGCMALVRADVWHELGGFDESFWMYGEDADLSLRASALGYRPMITPAATITHVVGASSSSPGNKAVLVLSARAALLRKHWSPVRSRIGIALLLMGCALRARLARDGKGWKEAWTRRHEWAAQADRGSQRTAHTV